MGSFEVGNLDHQPRGLDFKTLQIRGKLVCLSKPVKVTYNNKDASLLYNQYISIHYESVMFYTPGPGLLWKTMIVGLQVIRVLIFNYDTFKKLGCF